MIEAHHSRSFASLDVRLRWLIPRYPRNVVLGGTNFACSSHSSPRCLCPPWLRGPGSFTRWTLARVKNASRVSFYARSFCVNASLSISFTFLSLAVREDLPVLSSAGTKGGSLAALCSSIRLWSLPVSIYIVVSSLRVDGCMNAVLISFLIAK